MNEVIEGVINQSETAKKRVEAAGVKFKAVSHSEKNVSRYITNYAEGNSIDLIAWLKEDRFFKRDIFGKRLTSRCSKI